MADVGCMMLNHWGGFIRLKNLLPGGRYVLGLNNLFHLFIAEADYWDIYDNSQYPRKQIASGGKDIKTNIYEELQFKQIQEYVK